MTGKYVIPFTFRPKILSHGNHLSSRKKVFFYATLKIEYLLLRLADENDTL